MYNTASPAAALGACDTVVFNISRGRADLVQLEHDDGGAVFVGAGRAGETEPAHGLLLSLISRCHVCEAQVCTGEGAQPLPRKVVDGHHNAPCGLHLRHNTSACLVQDSVTGGLQWACWSCNRLGMQLKQNMCDAC